MKLKKREEERAGSAGKIAPSLSFLFLLLAAFQGSMQKWLTCSADMHRRTTACRAMLPSRERNFASAASPPPEIGVSFSPAGMLATFHLGVSAELQRLGIITRKCALAGSSGGAVAALTTALQTCDVESPISPLESSLFVARQCRDLGPRRTLRIALDEVLETSLPADVHAILQRRGAPVTIAFTALWRHPRGVLVSEFTSKHDLMDCIRASCNIPFYFNGNSMWVKARGMCCIDGIFATDMSRFGCPQTGAVSKEILVTPFRTRHIHLNPWKTHPAGSALKYSIISPDLLDKEHWPFSAQDSVRLALGMHSSTQPPSLHLSDEELERLYRFVYTAGQEAARRWYENQDWR